MKLGKFVKGYNNVAHENGLDKESLRECVNLDITPDGTLRTRDTLVQVYSGTNCHSLYENYFVEGADLKKFDEASGTAKVLMSNLGNSALSYITLNNEIYYSSPNYHGKIVNGAHEDWSTAQPSFTLSTQTGNLKAGMYLVDMTLVHTRTGIESAAAGTQQITVAEGSSIQLSYNLPANTKAYIYCSLVNGETLYYSSSSNTTSATISGSSSSNRPLMTQFMSAMPFGTKLTEHGGRLFLANDNVLWFSEPQRFDLTRKSTNWFQFNGKINVLGATDNGLFVVADKTYFLQGTDVKQMKQVVVSDDTAMNGEVVYINSANIGMEGDTELPAWMSNNGFVIGSANGQLVHLTKDRLAINNEADFVIQRREADSIRQLIGSVTGAHSSTYGASDKASVTIIRNGVTL